VAKVLPGSEGLAKLYKVGQMSFETYFGIHTSDLAVLLLGMLGDATRQLAWRV
jgi:hypothetical protein